MNYPNQAMSKPYPTRIDLCDGKYTVIYDLDTGRAECLHHGKTWRDLRGDKMVLAMFDRIVELEREKVAEKAQAEKATKP